MLKSKRNTKSFISRKDPANYSTEELSLLNQDKPRQAQRLEPVYRPDIDGMRALAVLAVVIFHAFPTALPGGFTGVDIFFVISGYLISSIIFRKVDAAAFSFADFYGRRVRRIFPALVLTFLFTYIFGWFWLMPDEFSSLGKHIAASAGFVQNFALKSEQGYFDMATNLKPLMHLWSLAIEEQFYLVFPFLILGATRFRINLFWFVILMGVASLGANLYVVATNPAKAYFLPHVRFWELLAGSFIAYLHGSKYAQLADRLQQFRMPMSLSGIALIFMGLFIIEKNYSFPGWWAMLPVGGTALFIFAGPQAWINRFIFSSKPMVGIGLISYPLYLWHWPLLSFAHITEMGAPSVYFRLGAVLLAFVLAYMTYVFVEKPIRFGAKKKRSTVFLVCAVSLAGLVGYATHFYKGFEDRMEKYAKIYKAAGEWKYPDNMTTETYEGINYYFRKTDRQERTLFIGDSNIEQYYPRIDELSDLDPKTTKSAIFKTGGGCCPIPGYKFEDTHKHCRTLMEDAKQLSTIEDVDTVVIGSNWYGYMHKQYGTELYREWLRNLSDYIKGIVAQNKRVYIVTNIPIGIELDPKYILNRSLLKYPLGISLREGGIEKSKLGDLYGQVQQDLEKVALESGATIINPMDFLCENNQCRSLDTDGEPMFKDSTHLRPFFVRNKATFIDKVVR